TFALTSLLVAGLGWRAGFLGPGLACTAIALVLYHALPDRPAAVGLPAPAADPSEQAHAALSVGDLQREVLRNPRVWLLGIASGFMYVARYAINDWGVLYLQIEKGYSLVDAGLAVSAFPVAGAVGSVLSGVISDRLFDARRAPVTLALG